ncbi:MAG: pyridoxamine 5'-phosphate oxidase family protein [Candidatus Reddybacter sp.]
MTTIIADSPFHRGEQILQQRLGVREQMERFGRQVIHDYLPVQHQAFYAQLPFVFVGHADSEGWPWASILFNGAGFIASDDAHSLQIKASPVAGDPLAHALQAGTRLGLLGIDLSTRRRNRLAARITGVSNAGMTLHVDQTFGNCPQYIQSRELVALDPQLAPAPVIQRISDLSDEARELIENSDTFFVASYKHSDSGQSSDGADVSHRGGKPGFIRVDDNTLIIPDYLGNNHFNTLGNFHETPKAGLLFVDFERGHLLTLTGRVEVLWDSSETQHFAGAERLWNFDIDHGYYQKNVLPLRWHLNDYSPNTLLTGSWPEAQALAQAEQQRDQWLPYKVLRVVDESRDIRSFYLQAEGHQKARFKPGQFLTIRAMINGEQVIRTYTLSSAPADTYYRISVKREAGSDDIAAGLMSNYLHHNVAVGDVLEAKSPRGDFSFDACEPRPAVLLSAGIGITPMLSMAKHALQEGVRTRNQRQLTLITTARNSQQRGFFAELDDIASQSKGHIRNYWALTQPDQSAQPGRDFHHRGRITTALLQALLPLADYEFYLCGPAAFMQAVYDKLRALGVQDARIFAEAFGPASLVRESDSLTTVFKPQAAASEAIVEFVDAQVEQAWSSGDGNLLDFAEAHGLSPEFGCRSGQCGACKVALVAGKVSYQSEPSAEVADNEVLLCCAVPAAVEGEDVVRLALQL